MKIVVLVKQTFDTAARIALDEEGRISQEGIKKNMNPFDEFAVEEAVRIKEKHGGEVSVVSLGGMETEEVLRQALAMGADKAVLLCDRIFVSDDASTRAAALAAYLRRAPFDILLAGWTSVDCGEAQTPARMAEILNIPQATIVTEIQLADGKATARCDTDEGVKVLEVELPALFTVQKGINEPRYPSFMGIMQAKKKPFATVTANDKDMPEALEKCPPKIKITRYEIPSRNSCKMLSGNLQDICRDLAQDLRPLL